MSDSAHRAAEHKPTRSVTALHSNSSQADSIPETTGIVRRFNAANKAHRNLWVRVMHATDNARRARLAASAAEAVAADAEAAYQAILAEHPDRSAPRVRQLLLMGLTVALDGLACNFAAQALGENQRETMLWTAFFLAVLVGGEIGLDLYRDHRSAWRLLVGGLTAFVAMLGVLRYSFLITVGTEGPVTALVGAALFTVATASLVALGYRALRAAETVPSWKARHRKKASESDARRARQRADDSVAVRDRLADAYLDVLRASLLESCTVSQLSVVQQAVRAHLTGQSARQIGQVSL